MQEQGNCAHACRRCRHHHMDGARAIDAYITTASSHCHQRSSSTTQFIEHGAVQRDRPTSLSSSASFCGWSSRLFAVDLLAAGASQGASEHMKL